MPYLRAPYYAWVGRPWADARSCIHHEQKVERPALFPPTFLYTQSWEDPEPDMKVGAFGKATMSSMVITKVPMNFSLHVCCLCVVSGLLTLASSKHSLSGFCSSSVNTIVFESERADVNTTPIPDCCCR